MADKSDTLSKDPVPDNAEYNAFFPSPYSLSQYVPPKSDLSGAAYPDAYGGGRWKILVVCTDERYIEMKDGRLFSTGNHPVETLIPVIHMAAAGFEIVFATVSGNMAKMELWAMPSDDAEIWDGFRHYLPQYHAPKKLGAVVAHELGDDSDYAAVFVPGGHGALTGGIPNSREMHDLLKWALAKDKFIISLCHGPACLLAGGMEEDADNPLFSGYSICVFPDSIDDGPNVQIGYVPGPLPWMLCEKLAGQGINILNKGISGQCHQDRKLLTGDSPLAGNTLGQLAAKALIAEFG